MKRISPYSAVVGEPVEATEGAKIATMMMEDIISKTSKGAADEDDNRENESVKEVYKRAFEAITGIPGWYIGADKWMFIPEVSAPLTRDEAFKNIYERKKR